MRTFFRTIIVLGLSVIVGVGLYALINSQVGTFGPGMFGSGGTKPGLQLLMKLQGDTNGGQIAPSFEQLQAEGRLPQGFTPGQAPSGMPQGLAGGQANGFPGAGGASKSAAPLSRGFAPERALGQTAHDVASLGIGALVAILLESLIVFGLRRRSAARRAAAAA